MEQMGNLDILLHLTTITLQVYRIPHWHKEMPHSEPINSFWRFIVELIKRGKNDE